MDRKMRSIAEISKEALLIANYLEGKHPGDFVSYAEIEQNTGVRMDNRGRAYLRTALNRRNIEVSVVPGMGYEIACEKTAMSILGQKIVRIDSAIKRGKKTHKRIFSQFYEKLDELEKKKVNFIGAAFAALSLASRGNKSLISRDVKTIPASTPTIPGIE